MIVIGASGHAKVVIEIAEQHALSIDAIYDQDVSKGKIFSYDIVHVLHKDMTNKYVIAVGDNATRKKIAMELPPSFCDALIHKNAIVSPMATIGQGSVVMAGAIINADAHIGKHVIINSGAIIEHDCIIEDYAHISPNAALAGGVTVKEGAQVGIGASVIQGLTIGKNAMVGAGAAIITNVPENTITVGVPGMPKK